MLKFIGMIALFLIAFASTLVGLLAVTGNLSRDTLDALLGKKPEPAATAAASEDVDALVMQLKAEREEVQERQEELDRREKRLKMLQRDIDERRTELAALLDEVKQGVAADEEGREQRLQGVAQTIEEMEAEKAAEVLSEWPVDEAAKILNQLSDRARGPILDAMDTDQVVLLLRALREGRE